MFRFWYQNTYKLMGTCIYNAGYLMLIKIMEVIGITIGKEALNYASKYNQQRLYFAERMSTSQSKEGRLARKYKKFWMKIFLKLQRGQRLRLDSPINCWYEYFNFSVNTYFYLWTCFSQNTIFQHEVPNPDETNHWIDFTILSGLTAAYDMVWKHGLVHKLSQVLPCTKLVRLVG